MTRAAERRRRQRRVAHANRPALDARSTPRSTTRDEAFATAVWWTAVVTLFAAQYLHWRIAGPHADEWAPAGVFFASLVIAEGAAAAVFAITRGRHGAAAVVAVNVVPACIWALDRSIGLPFGPDPWTRGSIGRADVVATVLELVSAACAAAFVRIGHRSAPLRVPDPGSQVPSSRWAAIGLGSLATIYAVGLYAFAVDVPMDEGPPGGTVSSATSGLDGSGPDATVSVVTATDLAFQPLVLMVSSGDTITAELVNADDVAHNLVVVAPGGPDGAARSSVVPAGGTTRVDVGRLASGTYSFYCELHPQMIGRIEAS